MLETLEKNCIECGTAFKGRIDKRFCSDQCRSTHNNRRNSNENSCVRNINNILRRNRRILMELNPNGKNKVPFDRLKSRGFNFHYYTSTYTTRDGAQYYYCYEQGYLAIDGDYFLLVVKKEF